MAQILLSTDYSATQRAVKLISNEEVPLPNYYTIGSFQCAEVIDIISKPINEWAGKTSTQDFEVDLVDYPDVLDVLVEALTYIYSFPDGSMTKELHNDLDVVMQCLKAKANEHSIFYRHQP